MGSSERKIAATATKARSLGAQLCREPVHAAWIVMPSGTYESGSIKQFYALDEEGEAVRGNHMDATLDPKDQVLLAVTDLRVHHFVVRPSATFGRLKWKPRGERPPFQRADLEVTAEHPDGLARFQILEPSTGRSVGYETWTTYGAAPYVQDLLRWLKAPAGHAPVAI